MIRPYVKYAVVAAVATAGIFLFFLSASAWGNMLAAGNREMFYLEQPVSIRDANEISKEDEMPEFCLWGQKEEIRLTNQNLFREVSADLILFCGNPELLFDGCGQPDREDTQGCLVDEGTAWELFGSHDVSGKEILYEGKSYAVRRVLPGNKKIFACRADGGSAAGSAAGAHSGTGGFSSAGDTSGEGGSFAADGSAGAGGSSAAGSFPGADAILNRITMKKPEGKTVQEVCDMWINRYGIALKPMDLELLRGVGGFCVLLFSFSVCVYFLVGLFRQCCAEQEAPVKAGIVVLIAVLSVCFGAFLAGRIHIPDEYIPSRWSDFSFWSNLWKEKQAAAGLLVRMPKTHLDGGWMADFAGTAGFGILAQVFFLIFCFICSKINGDDKKKRRIRE